MERGESDSVNRSNCPRKEARCYDVINCQSHDKSKQQKKKALTSAHLMFVRKATLRLKRPVENITPDVEPCRLLVRAREVVVEHIMGAVWSDIERIAH